MTRMRRGIALLLVFLYAGQFLLVLPLHAHEGEVVAACDGTVPAGPSWEASCDSEGAPCEDPEHHHHRHDGTGEHLCPVCKSFLTHDGARDEAPLSLRPLRVSVAADSGASPCRILFLYDVAPRAPPLV